MTPNPMLVGMGRGIWYVCYHTVVAVSAQELVPGKLQFVGKKPAAEVGMAAAGNNSISQGHFY